MTLAAEIDRNRELGSNAARVSLQEREKRRRARSRLLNLAPVTLFYLVFLVLPYLLMLRMSFNRYSSLKLYETTFTLDNYVSLITDPFYLELLARTIGLGVAVTVATLILGYPLALKIARSTGMKKTILLGIVLSPLLLNLVVRTYAWLILLGDKGVINSSLIGLGLVDAPLPIQSNIWSVTVGLAHITLPLMVLSLVGILETINRSLVEAAESLGATPERIFLKVIFPLSLPGIGTGSLLVFCFAISAFVTPALLGGHRVSTVSTVIYEKFTFAMNWPIGATLVFILLLLNLAVILLHGRMFRER